MAQLVVWAVMAAATAGCQGDAEPSAPEVTPSLSQTDVTLTYVCGNTFRVRNTGTDSVTVVWEVEGTTETGELPLPPKPTAEPHSEGYFATVSAGTARLFVHGQLVQTEANGGQPPCTVPGPSFPRLRYGRLPSFDTTKTVTIPGGTFEIYRTEARLRFDAGVSDSAKAVLFARHHMVVLGIDPTGAFYVRFPDPGPNIDALYALLEVWQAEPEILRAMVVFRTPLKQIGSARYPTDGSGFQRNDYVGSATSTWAFRAVRAPLAWGCEQGAYAGAAVRIGLFEWKHDPAHPDFAASQPALREPPDSLLQSSPVSSPVVDDRIAHSTSTTGLLTASGDDGIGVAGMMWRTQLFQYAGYSSGNRPLDLETGFYLLAGAIAADQIRVLTLSADGQFPAGLNKTQQERRVQDLADELRSNLLDRNPSLLVVLAAGNERYRGTAQSYARADTAAAVRAALLRLRQEPAYQDRIVVVVGTRSGNQFWDSWPANPAAGSNAFSDATDIAAPAEDIAVLDRATGGGVPTRVASGTSLSAPLVAGAAAQLIAMNPSLSPDLVKDYLVRGAQQPRTSATTGADSAPTAVAGAPSTVYQLDAYGSLRLLSRERAGMPICGVPVSVEGNALRIGRTAPEQVAVALPPAQTFAVTSIAPGGRRVAVRSTDWHNTEGHPLYATYQFTHTGTLIDSLPTVYHRQYLERDTADFVYIFAPPLLGGDQDMWVRMKFADGSGQFSDLGNLVERGVPDYQEFGRASPDGQWLLVGGEFRPSSGVCASVPWYPYARVYLFNLRTRQKTKIREGLTVDGSCAPLSTVHDEWVTGAVWAPEGNRVVFGVLRGLGESATEGFDGTALVDQAVAAPVPPATETFVAGPIVEPFSITADGAVMHTDEVGSDCRNHQRLARPAHPVLAGGVVPCDVSPPAELRRVAIRPPASSR